MIKSLIKLIVLLMAGISFAGSGMVVNMEVTENSCNSNSINIRTTIINQDAFQRNLTITYYAEDMYAILTKNIVMNGMTQKSSDDILSIFMEQGDHTVFVRVFDENETVTGRSDFIFKTCLYEYSEIKNDLNSLIHRKMFDNKIEAWQLFLLILLASTIMFSNMGKPFGKKNTIKTLPSLLLSAGIMAILLSMNL